MMIHTITLIEKKPHFDKEIGIDMGKIHRIGFYPTLDDAKLALKYLFTGDDDFCKTDYDRFQYCVIESIDEGIPANVTRTLLYQWVDGKFKRVADMPEEFELFTNYCIG